MHFLRNTKHANPPPPSPSPSPPPLPPAPTHTHLHSRNAAVSNAQPHQPLPSRQMAPPSQLPQWAAVPWRFTMAIYYGDEIYVKMTGGGPTDFSSWRGRAALRRIRGRHGSPLTYFLIQRGLGETWGEPNSLPRPTPTGSLVDVSSHPTCPSVLQQSNYRSFGPYRRSQRGALQSFDQDTHSPHMTRN
eukprot:COSAG02_NODE_192_length_29942_cov_34.627228_19_plen_188_part_00